MPLLGAFGGGGYVSEKEGEGGIVVDGWMDGWMEGLRKRKGEMQYCIPSRINDALYAPANGLEGVRADARGSLRDALDSLAGFGG